MKIIVVDDSKTFREGIKYHLENILNHEVIGLAADGDEFLKMENTYRADIILMDIELPKLNGIETVKKALWNYSFQKFIAVTSYIQKTCLRDLLGAGFKACVFKDDNIYNELKQAIEKVIKNEFYFPAAIKLEKEINH